VHLAHQAKPVADINVNRMRPPIFGDRASSEIHSCIPSLRLGPIAPTGPVPRTQLPSRIFAMKLLTPLKGNSSESTLQQIQRLVAISSRVGTGISAISTAMYRLL
jgi:hypothetical protein